MEAFEQIVARVFDRDGYWIKQSYKVDVTKEEKRLIGTHSMPRVEIDLLAFRAIENVVHVIECKSYLDNPGVSVESFRSGSSQDRYKLFNDANRRQIVFEALRRQLVRQNICASDVQLKLGLVTGKIRKGERGDLQNLFRQKGWDLWDDLWIAKKLREFSANLYENSVIDMTVKLIGRADQSA